LQQPGLDVCIAWNRCPHLGNIERYRNLRSRCGVHTPIPNVSSEITWISVDDRILVWNILSKVEWTCAGHQGNSIHFSSALGQTRVVDIEISAIHLGPQMLWENRSACSTDIILDSATIHVRRHCVSRVYNRINKIRLASSESGGYVVRICLPTCHRTHSCS